MILFTAGDGVFHCPACSATAPDADCLTDPRYCPLLDDPGSGAGTGSDDFNADITGWDDVPEMPA